MLDVPLDTAGVCAHSGLSAFSQQPGRNRRQSNILLNVKFNSCQTSSWLATLYHPSTRPLISTYLTAAAAPDKDIATSSSTFTAAGYCREDNTPS